MIDYVLPNKNEKEFLDMATKLGYKELVFLYSLKDFKGKGGIVCEAKELGKAKNKTEIVVVKCKDDVKQVIERSPSFIYGMEDHNNMDFMHHKNSGLNHVLVKLMKTKNVGYMVDFNGLLNSDRTRLLSRIKFNINLCKKYKVNVVIASFANDPYKMKGKKDMLL
jgi:RNase P/RNase MRP subunit p30